MASRAALGAGAVSGVRRIILSQHGRQWMP